MEQNKKNHKFKLVKWKKKLVPTLFGTFISLNPLMIIASNDDKSSKSSSQSADRNSVENEKTRIQGLSKQTITKSVIKVNANSLTAQELGIDKGKIEGVKHTITHKEVTSDTNDLDVSIDIKKGSQTLTTTMKVKIIGINATKDIETVKALFNSLENPSNGKYVTDSTLKDASTTLPSSLSSQTTPETIGFEDPSKGKRNGVNVSFQVKNHSNAVGTLTVEVTLSKNQGKTEKFEFILKGYKVDTGNLVAITQQNVNQIIEEVRETKIKLSSKYYIKLNGKINWPKDLSIIKWGRLQGLTKYNTPFKGDISNLNISWSIFKDVYFSQVTRWPQDLLQISWEGARGLTKDNTPFNGDISKFKIFGSSYSKFVGIKRTILKGMDVSKVSKWPINLSYINWEGVKGLNNYSTPFKGNISKLNIEASFFKGVDVSQVTKWPIKLTAINWEGVKGLTKDNTPFKDNISNLMISGNITFDTSLKDVDVSKVTIWPKGLYPNGLSDINWEGIKGLTKENTPFKGDISNLDIYSSIFKGVDVSQVTKWREWHRQNLDLEGAIGKEKSFANIDINKVKSFFDEFTNVDSKKITTLKDRKIILPSSLIDASTPKIIGFVDPSKDKRNDVKVSFSVENANDGEGTLVVKVTLSKRFGDTQTIKFTLKGYQTTNEAIIAANKRISEVKELFDNLVKNKTPQKLEEKILPSKLKTNRDNTPKNIGFDLPAKVKDNKDVTISFSIKSFNDANGSLVVEATISKTLGKSETIQFTLIGYQTTEQANRVIANKDILAAKELFSKFLVQGGTPTILSGKETTLPSTLSGETNPNKIGFDNPLEKDSVDAKGVTATFNVKSIDDTNGKLVVEVTLSKTLGSSLTFTFTLIGYQTTAKANEAAAKQQAVNNEKTRIEKLPKIIITREFDILANNLKEKDLQLGIGLQGAEYKITHGLVSSNQATFNVSVKIKKDGKEAIATREVSLTGINAAKKARALIAAIIDDVGPDNTQLQVVTGKKTASIETAVAEINNKAKFNEYTGKDLSGIPNINLANFSSKIVGQNIEVTITIPRLNSGNTIKYLIAGLKTQAKLNEVAANKAIKAAKELFNDLKNADPGTETNLPAKTTTLPSTLSGATTAADIGFDDPSKSNGQGVSATFSVKDVDDANGKLVVEVTLSKALGKSEKFDFTLIGYQTKANRDISIVKKLFDKLVNANPKTPTNLLKGATTLPSALISQTTPEAIGFDNPLEKDSVDAKGVTATFNVKSTDDTNGKLVVEVTISKDSGTNQKVKFTLTGYQTKANRDISIVKKLFDKLVKNGASGTPTNLLKGATTLPSELADKTTADEIGFTNPYRGNKKGVIAAFNVKSTDDTNGKLVVEVTISKDSGTNQIVEFTLTGYQTKANRDISIVKKLFDKLVKNGASGTPTNLLKGATTLPSELANKTTADEIGFTNPYRGNKKGVKKGVIAAFSVKDVDDANGKLVVEVTISKDSGTNQKVKFTLTGYQTKANRDISIVKKLFDKLVKNGASGTPTNLLKGATTLPSTLISQTTPEAIGFEDPSKGERNGVDVSFKVKNHSNAIGTIIVEVTLSKDLGKTEKFEFILKGYKLEAGNLLLITSKNVNKEINEAREKRIKLSSKYYIKLNKKIDWPKDLSKINWDRLQGLTEHNTPFKGDISNFKIFGSILKGIDVSKVTKWPLNLQGINWEGAIGIKPNQLINSKIPLIGDISLLNISNSILKDIDVSQVTIWPQDLSNINWEGVIGLSSSNTPFKEDISSFNIFGSFFKGVNVSEVTTWPQDLSNINWEGVQGLKKEKTPFKEDISSFNIFGSILKGIDVSKVTKWPLNLQGINWEGAIGIKPNQLINSKIPMIGDISLLNISNSILKDIDVSQVTIWPQDLSNINWEGVIGLSSSNTPFKEDISSFNIFGSFFKGVNVSEVTTWPQDLSNINWEGVQGLKKEKTPFKEDISSFNIFGSILKGIDVSKVTKWPQDLSSINWEGVIGLSSSNTPFKEDISSFNIFDSILKDVDVSEVTIWPQDLSNINWKGVKGLNSGKTPFKGDISNFNIFGSSLYGVDVSQVTKWPINLFGINWEGVKELTKEKTPFKGNISNLNICGGFSKLTFLKGVDVSQVTQWPTNLKKINWEGVKGLNSDRTPFKGDISKFDIYGSFFKGVDVSQVTKWPKNLLGINWEGVVGKELSLANIDINTVKSLFDEFKNVASGKTTTLKNRKIILPSSLISKITSEAIGFVDPSKGKRNGVSVSFKVKSYDDDKGTLVIQVTFSKNPGLNQIVEFTLTGYQTKSKRITSNTQDIQNEKTRIEKLDRITIYKFLSSINKNLLLKSELALGDIPKGISYEIIHKKIDNYGNFDVTIKIKKGSQEIEATRKTLIADVVFTKHKIASQKASRLSKGAIAGIAIGASFVTFGISFIIYRFLKLKKFK